MASSDVDTTIKNAIEEAKKLKLIKTGQKVALAYGSCFMPSDDGAGIMKIV